LDEGVQSYNYSLDREKSLVEWTGSSPKVSHKGSFDVISDGIQVVNGRVVAGTFIIPIASIKNYDLPNTVKPVLLKHLKSEDFFNMALFPEAGFSITEVVPLDTITAGAVKDANTWVKGNFTMLGQEHPIDFPSSIILEGDDLKVEALLLLTEQNGECNMQQILPIKKDRFILMLIYI
jgi:polyisoprenoid-binding protein YceI